MDKLDSDKRRLIEELKKSHGIVSMACENAGCCRQTYYNYLNNDADFKAEVENIQEEAIDFVESKLFQKINGITIVDGDAVYKVAPDTPCIIFYLKTKAKKRGYIERTELAGPDGSPFQIVIKTEDQATAESVKKVQES